MRVHTPRARGGSLVTGEIWATWQLSGRELQPFTSGESDRVYGIKADVRFGQETGGWWWWWCCFFFFFLLLFPLQNRGHMAMPQRHLCRFLRSHQRCRSGICAAFFDRINDAAGRGKRDEDEGVVASLSSSSPSTVIILVLLIQHHPSHTHKATSRFAMFPSTLSPRVDLHRCCSSSNPASCVSPKAMPRTFGCHNRFHAAHQWQPALGASQRRRGAIARLFGANFQEKEEEEEEEKGGKCLMRWTARCLFPAAFFFSVIIKGMIKQPRIKLKKKRKKKEAMGEDAHWPQVLSLDVCVCVFCFAMFQCTVPLVLRNTHTHAGSRGFAMLRKAHGGRSPIPTECCQIGCRGVCSMAAWTRRAAGGGRERESSAPGLARSKDAL